MLFQFVKAAVEFLCEDVMLRDNARGVSLHLVDVFTEEFRVLLDRAKHPSSCGEDSDATTKVNREQEVKSPWRVARISLLHSLALHREWVISMRPKYNLGRKLETPVP